MYPYAGYPLVLWMTVFLRKRRSSSERLEYLPFVSVIVAVRNEERNVRNRISNLLTQRYPNNRLEIVVASDGSTDGTNEILQEIIRENRLRTEINEVKLVSYQPCKGKSAAINEAVKIARGEILVFADARQRFDSDAVKKLVAALEDPSVGCVSGELHFEQIALGEGTSGVNLYWRYEKWIRKQESRTGSTVGVTGAIYAMRRTLFEPLPQNTILDDVLIPLMVGRKRFAIAFCEEAKAYDKPSHNMGSEWRRKVRTLAGNWQLLSIDYSLLLPWKNPLWFRFVSHKLSRLLVPAFLPVVFVTSIVQEDPLFRALGYAQILLYFLALVGLVSPICRSVRLVNLCYFFVVMNAAAVIGFFKWVTGSAEKIWR